MESPKEAGITIREAARTLSPTPVPYVVDELLKPSSPVPTSSSREPAISAPVPEQYVVDDFLVASPALKVDLDASQLLGDPTVLAQSLLVDELEALHQGDELTSDVGAAVIPRPLNNGLESVSPVSPALSHMVNIPPVTSNATYTIAVRDDASTPAPVEVIAVNGYPTGTDHDAVESCARGRLGRTSSNATRCILPARPALRRTNASSRTSFSSKPRYGAQ